MSTQGNQSGNGNQAVHSYGIEVVSRQESEIGSSVSGASRRRRDKLKDFVSDQEVRWCPGCGDYAILNNVQKVMPELGIPRENIVFVSGIGCSSALPVLHEHLRLPHDPRPRAGDRDRPQVRRPDLSVWVITGDGDALSIGGNHFIHAMRRNVDSRSSCSTTGSTG
jgi:pyruvate/2-oxoacid:ferredoxin oxidoreductase beta subunit